MNTKLAEIKEGVDLVIYGELMPKSEREIAYRRVAEIKAKYGLKNLKKYFYLASMNQK